MNGALANLNSANEILTYSVYLFTYFIVNTITISFFLDNATTISALEPLKEQQIAVRD